MKKLLIGILSCLVLVACGALFSEVKEMNPKDVCNYKGKDANIFFSDIYVVNSEVKPKTKEYEYMTYLEHFPKKLENLLDYASELCKCSDGEFNQSDTYKNSYNSKKNSSSSSNEFIYALKNDKMSYIATLNNIQRYNLNFSCKTNNKSGFDGKLWVKDENMMATDKNVRHKFVVYFQVEGK